MGMPPRILVIDDEEIVRSSIVLILRQYAVLEAANGREGLEVYRAQTPELVLTDLSMPGLGGREVIAQLRQSSPPPKIIAMSGNADCIGDNSVILAHQLGIDRILSKPFGPKELLGAVASVLAA
jgi:CheY-like chemotaxis protein